MKGNNNLFRIMFLGIGLLLFLIATPLTADARITKIEISAMLEPTYPSYQRITGKAYGEVNPSDPLNAEIQDIELAPRNARGNVEYVTDLLILKPVDPSLGSGILLYEAPNRGSRIMEYVSFEKFDSTWKSDNFLKKRGHTLVWSGWQGDLTPGGGRMRIIVPVATNIGTPITGRLRSEFIVNAPVSTIALSGGAVPAATATHIAYETISVNKVVSGGTLTRRIKEGDPRIPVPDADWKFADCTTGTTFAAAPPSTRNVCINGGFQTNYIYELLYTAKDPLVLGLGFAATRDLISFLRYSFQDDFGNANPLAGTVNHAIMHGLSQGGRFVRSYLDLGFNEDEQGNMAFDVAWPHIASGRLPLNVRFGMPGRGGGSQHEDHLYPAMESPFTWMPINDPVAKRKGWILKRSKKTNTCPKIIQTVSSSEYWQGRMSLNTTNAHGRHDVGLPGFVRIYHFAGTQHVLPVFTGAANYCQQFQNPNNYMGSMRALLVAVEDWVSKDVKPPDNMIATLRRGTLVPSDQESIGWPSIPGVKYTGLVNELTLLDHGPDFDDRFESGIMDEPTEVVDGRKYTVLVPIVDEDGNEVDGIRSVTLQAPLGTYTGWNLRKVGFAEDELCGLVGTFVPFKKTAAERVAAGDPRLSLEERYSTQQGYVDAVTAAAQSLVAAGLLLPDDAQSAINAAIANPILP